MLLERGPDRHDHFDFKSHWAMNATKVWRNLRVVTLSRFRAPSSAVSDPVRFWLLTAYGFWEYSSSRFLFGYGPFFRAFDVDAVNRSSYRSASHIAVSLKTRVRNEELYGEREMPLLMKDGFQVQWNDNSGRKSAEALARTREVFLTMRGNHNVRDYGIDKTKYSTSQRQPPPKVRLSMNVLNFAQSW